MKYIKKFEKYKPEFIEAWEIDNNDELTGFSEWLTQDEIDELVQSEIIIMDPVHQYYGIETSEPFYLEKDREKIEYVVQLRLDSKKYNL